MSDIGTIVVSIVGGSAAGAALGAWQAARLRTTTRRGRARLIHEDLYRLQSMVTRMYYERTSEHAWGDNAWLLAPLANKEDQQDVLAHLKGWRFGVCAGALGWAEYVRGGRGPGIAARILRRSGYGASEPSSDEELRRMYERLAWGRAALSTLARLPYEPHDPDLVVGTDKRRRNVDKPLEKIDKDAAEQGAKEYRSQDDTALRQPARTQTSEDRI